MKDVYKGLLIPEVQRKCVAGVRTTALGLTLPIGDVRFDGEFRKNSGLVVLTSSFVEIDPEGTWQM
jgi:hypothetical protein